jgi:hypothetical protein
MSDSPNDCNSASQPNVVATPNNTNAPSAAQRTATDPPPEIEPPQMTDVSVKKPRLPWVVASFGVLAAGLAVAVSHLAGIRGFSASFAVGVLIAPLFIVSFRLGRRSQERRIARIVSNGPRSELAEVVCAAVQPASWPSDKHPVSELARRLALHGRSDETIRMQWSGESQIIEPLMVAFEPTLLDETDPRFEDFRSAAAPTDNQDSTPSAARSNHDDVLNAHRVKRNMLALLRNAWIVVLMLAFFTFRSAWESYQRRSITLGLLFWVTMITVLLCSPARGGWFGTRQWLLTPGSLIVRKARWRDRTSRVHLFERRKSVLCLYQQREEQWLLAVADADACEQTVATDAEVSLLLRAWLSPLEPPPVERLSDLR